MTTPLPTDLGTLTADEQIRLREEVRLAREYRLQQLGQHRVPFLPVFSGDSSGVDFSHFKSAIDSITTSNNDASVLQAIRKSTSGQAAKVLAALDYTTSKDDVIATLEASFGKICDTASCWAEFYAASQHHKESLIEWRTRLFMLHQKTGNTIDSDLQMKTRLYQGLRDSRMKDQALFKYEDSTVSEANLLQFLRKIQENHKHTNAGSNALQDTSDDKVAKLEAQVASLTLSLQQEKAKKKKKTKKKAAEVQASSDESDADEQGYLASNQRYPQRDHTRYNRGRGNNNWEAGRRHGNWEAGRRSSNWEADQHSNWEASRGHSNWEDDQTYNQHNQKYRPQSYYNPDNRFAEGREHQYGNYEHDRRQDSYYEID